MWCFITVTMLACTSFGKASRMEQSVADDMAQHDTHNPGELYDETWLKERCDIKMSAVENNSFYSKNEWVDFKKCESTSMMEFENVIDRETCAAKCRELAKMHRGRPYCCEYDQDNAKCTAAKGWSANIASSRGELARWRHPKVVMFLKEIAEEGPVDMHEESTEAQKYFGELVKQINHMSLSGIMHHLMSFYICMRWVPDDQFVKVAKFEMENIDVDYATPKRDDVKEDDIIKSYVEFDMLPLKCNEAIHVQDLKNIDALLRQFENDQSDLHEAFTFSSQVASKSWMFDKSDGHFKRWGAGMRVSHTKQALSNKLVVSEAVDNVHRVLPWDGFLRPSQMYKKEMNTDTHVSKAKNLFFLCFGPRIASFPHKHQDGKHILADQNMGGCNGLWDLETMAANLKRLKLLFAPQTCLVESMEVRLKGTFLQNFVSMNVNFEEMLTGSFGRSMDFLRATPEEALKKMLEKSGWWSEVEKIKQGVVQKKYERTSRLVAGGHTKWLICDAKPSVTSEPFGFSESFFRSASAYAKWLPELDEESHLECMIVDTDTSSPGYGCVKCVTGVFSHPNRCPLKRNLDLSEVWLEVARGKQPFTSPFAAEVSLSQTRTDAIDKLADGHVDAAVAIAETQGFCAAGRKSPRTGIPAEKEKMEKIYRVTPPQHHGTFSLRSRPRSVQSVNENLTKCAQSLVPDSAFHRWSVSQSSSTEKGGVEFNIKAETGQSQSPVMLKQLGKVFKRFKRLCLDPVEKERVEDMAAVETHELKDFGTMFVFEELVDEVNANNRKAHYVQYVNVCPCSQDDRHNVDAFNTFGFHERML